MLAYLTLSRLSKTKEVLVVGITTGVDKIRRMFAGVIIQKRKMFACKVVDHTHRIVLIPLTCSLPPNNSKLIIMNRRAWDRRFELHHSVDLPHL